MAVDGNGFVAEELLDATRTEAFVEPINDTEIYASHG